MQIIRFKCGDKLNIQEELSLCLGYFDGLHLGHRKLIKIAQDSNYKSGLLTFDMKISLSKKSVKHITSLDDKIDILSKLGLDYLFILEFDQEVKNLTPIEFIDKIIKSLNAREIIIGEDYTFGKEAKGNYQTLIENQGNYVVKRIEDLKYDNNKISTSQIISLIKEGKIKTANTLLGKYYTITSKVLNGNKIGRNYEYPTANLSLDGYICPKLGVYACKIMINDNIYQGMANIGTHPTIYENNVPLLEVNIFDFNNDIYQQDISVSLIDFIREEKTFSSIDELYNQLKIDKIKIKEILNK